MSFTRKCWFYLVCLFTGLCTGAVGGYFQFFLHKADHLRMELTTWAHSVSFWEGFGAVLLVCVACAVIGRFLVRFAPTAGGSGIQYVEAAWREEVEPARFKILLVLRRYFDAWQRHGPRTRRSDSPNGRLNRCNDCPHPEILERRAPFSYDCICRYRLRCGFFLSARRSDVHL